MRIAAQAPQAMRRKILGSVQDEIIASVTVIIIQVLRIVLTNSFLCVIINMPHKGEGLCAPLGSHHQRMANIKAAIALIASITKLAIS